MELLDFPIHLNSSRQRVFVHGFSDIHYYAPGSDHAKLRRRIRDVKRGNEEGPDIHLWFGGGDWANCLSLRDPRTDATSVRVGKKKWAGNNLLGEEAADLVEEFESIQEWGIAIGTGNHEEKAAKFSDYNASREVARMLRLPYLGYYYVVRFRLHLPNRGGQSVVFQWHHGRGAARTKASKAGMLFKLGELVGNAHVYGCGHTHELADLPASGLAVPTRGQLRLDHKPRFFFNAGTFLKTYPTDTKPQQAGKFDKDRDVSADYAEIQAYPPAVIDNNGFSMWLSKKNKEGGKTIKLGRLRLEVA